MSTACSCCTERTLQGLVALVQPGTESQVRSMLLKTTRERFEQRYVPDVGLIVAVNKLLHVSKGSRDMEVTVTFTANVCHLKRGQTLSNVVARITDCTAQGCVVQLHDRVHLLVAAAHLPEMRFDREQCAFISTTNVYRRLGKGACLGELQLLDVRVLHDHEGRTLVLALGKVQST